MNSLKSSPDLGFIMLVALREIVTLDCEGITQNISELLPVLQQQADNDDEGSRAMIAEIIGKLLAIDPTEVITNVKSNLNSPNANIISTYALSFKHWFGRGKGELSSLRDSLPGLLNLFKDTGLKVLNSLLETFTHIAHINSMFLLSSCNNIFNAIIPLTVFNDKLVKVVDLGPMQHRMDEG